MKKSILLCLVFALNLTFCTTISQTEEIENNTIIELPHNSKVTLPCVDYGTPFNSDETFDGVIEMKNTFRHLKFHDTTKTNHEQSILFLCDASFKTDVIDSLQNHLTNGSFKIKLLCTNKEGLLVYNQVYINNKFQKSYYKPAVLFDLIINKKQQILCNSEIYLDKIEDISAEYHSFYKKEANKSTTIISIKSLDSLKKLQKQFIASNNKVESARIDKYINTVNLVGVFQDLSNNIIRITIDNSNSISLYYQIISIISKSEFKRLHNIYKEKLSKQDLIKLGVSISPRVNISFPLAPPPPPPSPINK